MRRRETWIPDFSMTATRLKLVVRSAALLWLAAVALSCVALRSVALGGGGWPFALLEPTLVTPDLTTPAAPEDPLAAAALLLGALGGLAMARRRLRAIGAALWLAAGLAVVGALSAMEMSSNWSEALRRWLQALGGERPADTAVVLAPAAAASILLLTAAALLLALRRSSLAQIAAVVAMLPPLVKAVGLMLGVETLLGAMPAADCIMLLLSALALLAGSAHRGALRVFFSDSLPGHFARHQVLIASLTPLGFAVLFERLLPQGLRPNGAAEIVVTTALVAWVSIGATAIVGRRLDLARHRAEAELERLARHDPLTGLLNRRIMEKVLPARYEQARSAGRPVALLMCDLDHFKQLNDEYGHVVGDDVLRRTAERVSAAVRDTDLVFRYGGEEIAVLLDCEPAEAFRIGEKIREAVKASGRRADDPDLPPITISIGAAASEACGTALSRLLACADECLYSAKNAGRDCLREVTLP